MVCSPLHFEKFDVIRNESIVKQSLENLGEYDFLKLRIKRFYKGGKPARWCSG